MIRKIPFVILALAIAHGAVFGLSTALVFPAREVRGGGPLPYNYRLIDGRIHVGGHPLNPATRHGNTDSQAMSILEYLKEKGVADVIDLQNSKKIEKRYLSLLERAGIRRMHVPLHSHKVPDAEEWGRIKDAMQRPVYIHCTWGADRAGMVVARYLVEEKGHSPDDALKAVMFRGTHAGALGGFKDIAPHARLKEFIASGTKGARKGPPRSSEDKRYDGSPSRY